MSSIKFKFFEKGKFVKKETISLVRMMEDKAAQAAIKAGIESLKTELQALADQAAREYECKYGRLKRKSKEKFQFLSKFGKVEIKTVTGYHTDSKGNEIRVNTLKAVHAIERGGSILPKAESDIIDTACNIASFEGASHEAAKWGWNISDDKIMDLVVDAGKRCDAKKLPPLCRFAADKDDILIIMMDGWMAREREELWGKKRTNGDDNLLHAGWHEVRCAVLFTIKSVTKTSKNRNTIIQKYKVACAPGTDYNDFGKKVFEAAKHMGMLRAKRTYFVMDGGKVLWNIFKDRFSQYGKGKLDFYHLAEHLKELSNDIYGEDTEEARSWYKKHRRILKTYGEKALLKEIENFDYESFKDPEGARREAGYVSNHAGHMDYDESRDSGIPIGSGAMESLCGQLQHRFKGIGKFWSRNHLKYFLETYVWHMNGELEYALS